MRIDHLPVRGIVDRAGPIRGLIAVDRDDRYKVRVTVVVDAVGERDIYPPIIWRKENGFINRET